MVDATPTKSAMAPNNVAIYSVTFTAKSIATPTSTAAWAVPTSGPTTGMLNSAASAASSSISSSIPSMTMSNVPSTSSARASSACATSRHGCGPLPAVSARLLLRMTNRSAALPDQDVSSTLEETLRTALCSALSDSANARHWLAVARRSSQSPKNGFLIHSSTGLYPKMALHNASTAVMAMRALAKPP